MVTSSHDAPESIVPSPELDVDTSTMASVLTELVAANPGVIFRYDPASSGTLFVSPNVAQIMGYPQQAFIAHPSFWPEHIHSDDQAVVMDAQAQAIAARRERVDYEYRFMHGDGDVRWFFEIRSMRYAPDDALSSYVGYAIDISERKQAELALQLTERRFQTLLATMTHGAFFTNRDGMIVEVNPAAERIFGLTRQQLLAHSVRTPAWERVNEDGTPRSATTSPTELVRTTGQPQRDVVRGMRHALDGRIHWLRITAIPENFIENGLPCPVYTIFEDITEERAAEQALRESEVRFRTLFEHSPDAITLVDPHDSVVPWRIIDGNPAAWAMHGYTREELIDKTNEVLNAEQGDWIDDGQFMDLMRDGDATHGRVHHRRKDGSIFSVEYSAVLVTVNGQELVLGIDRDATEKLAAERALRESEERFRQLAEHMREIFWLVEVDRDCVIYASPAFEQIWGMERERLYEQRAIWYEVIHLEDRERVRAAIPKQHAGTYDEEYRIVRPDGTVRWVRDRCFPVYDAQGAVYRLAGITEEITARKQAEELLRHQALYDPLTGLPNRALLQDRLGNALARTRRHQEAHFALLFLDLDRFKRINDSLGHAAGDALLIGVARRLEICLRPGDTVARLGGDEFILLLDEIADVRDAIAVAERIQETLAAPFNIEGHSFNTSASIGITLSDAAYERPEDILRDADTAMYRAKAQGRARHAIFDPQIHD